MPQRKPIVSKADKLPELEGQTQVRGADSGRCFIKDEEPVASNKVLAGATLKLTGMKVIRADGSEEVLI